MNSTDLKTIFEMNDFSTGVIQAVYTFNSGTGCIVFNDFYPTGQQLENGVFTNPIAETFPAAVISCDPSFVSNLSNSSGVFQGEDVLQVTAPISTGAWTFFVDYRRPKLLEGNKACVLVSTMEDYTGASGFNFGINASNRPYFEYIDEENNRKIFTHSQALGTNNLISVSQNETILNITNHDIGSFLHNEEQFTINNFVESEDLWIGNFPTGTNPSNYTGFSGNIDSFVLYGSPLPLEDQNIIAEDYFYSGFKAPSTSGTPTSGRQVTGVDVNLSGITGSGITGYIPAIYKTIETCLHGDINFYRDSGVSGDLLGEVVTFQTGSGWVTGITYTDFPAQRVNDYGKTLKYAEQGITFLKEIKSGDVFEVYSYNTFHLDKLNLLASYIGGRDYFFTSTGYKSGNLNVYGNGLAQYSGDQFTIVNGDLDDKNINFINNNFSGTDTVIFDIINGTQEEISTFSGFAVTGLNLLTSGPTVSFDSGENVGALAFTGNVGSTIGITGLLLTSGGSGCVVAPTVTINGGGASSGATAEALIDQNNYVISAIVTGDPYLDGYKLISGVDYTQNTTEITLTASNIQNAQYTTGDILFLPRITNDYVRVTGLASQFINTQTHLVEEQLWLNRKRLQRQEDYIRVADLGLLKASSFITGTDTILYNNDNNFFNT